MVDMSMAVAVYGFVQRERRIEEAGISYETSVVKHKLSLGQPTGPVYRPPASMPHVDSTTSIEDEEIGDWLDSDDAKYEKYISKQDPNNWKEQDHYKVLGLSKLRYKATPSQLKAAYRQKVLKYHPDKGKLKTGRNEAIFACIQKAYEQLGDTMEKRRAYDSVDPKFDEAIPESSAVNRKNFFDVLAPVFERNARFSVVQPVPELGNAESMREEVEAFYEFWYNWKSWREFSYLDEEDKSKGEDRWERREIEKINKAEREKRRKKDAKRILTLVEMAYEKDPRIVAFKEEEKRERELEKERRRQERERKAAEKRAQEEEEERRQEAERQKQQEEERLAAQAKQKQKKALTAQRKALREVALNANYWTTDADEQHTIMEHVERVCMNAELDEMADLCKQLSDVKLFDDAVGRLKAIGKKGATATGHQKPKASANENGGATSWTTEETQLLVKAANLYPPGTVERWKQVAQYIADHSTVPGGKLKGEKDIIKQVKALKVIEASQPVKAAVAAAASAQFSTGGSVANKENGSVPAAPAADEWSAAQQKQLEVALKSTPSSDPERWDKIAAQVDGKSKKECVQRYKKLAQMVKESKKN